MTDYETVWVFFESEGILAEVPDVHKRRPYGHILGYPVVVKRWFQGYSFKGYSGEVLLPLRSPHTQSAVLLRDLPKEVREELQKLIDSIEERPSDT